MKRPALQNKRVADIRMAFRAGKVFGTFEKRVPGVCLWSVVRRTLHDLYMSVFLITSHIEVDPKYEGTIRDAY